MLRALSMKNVGPAEEMSLDPLGARLNLITGDNGLGKSFLLELAWWTLTGAMGNPCAMRACRAARLAATAAASAASVLPSASLARSRR